MINYQTSLFEKESIIHNAKNRLNIQKNNFKDKTGKTYGRLKVVKLANPKIILNTKTKKWWWCECSCRKKCVLISDGNLRKEGGTKSCGCLNLYGINQRTINSDLVIGKTVGFLTILNDLRWEELPKNIKTIYKKTKGNFLETKCIKCNRKKFLTLTLLGQLRKNIVSKESQYMGCDWCSLSERSINYSGQQLGPWLVLDEWRRIENPRKKNTGKGPETILEWRCKCTLCNETESWIKSEILSHISTKKEINRGVIGCGCQRHKIKKEFGNLVDQTSFERYYNAKKRAAEKGLDFNIDPTDCIAPKYCPILGIELKSSNKGFDENSPSLDRFYPSKGYIKGNVQVISLLANRMKNDGTPEDWIKIANWVKSKDIMKKILGKDHGEL